jgi:Tfp pilus assembly protein PilX
MKRNQNITSRQRGIALLFTLLTLLVLSSLAAAIIFVTQTEIWSFSNYQKMMQARYAAEAGAQNTLNWLLYTYTAPTSMSAFDLTKYPIQDAATHNTIILSAMTGVTSNYPTAAVQTAFSSSLKDASVPGVGVAASSEVTAKLLSMQAGAAGGQPVQSWEITSQGNVAGLRNAQVQVVMRIERTGTPLFGYGIFSTGTGCGAITFGGGAYTDSYNSSAGTYATTVQTSGGNVGTNGNMTINGSTSQVKGTLSSADSGTGACGGGTTTALTASSPGQVTGGVVSLSHTITYANPPAPSPTPPTTTMSLSGNCGTVPTCTDLAAKSVALAPGQYGNLSASGGTAVHLSAGTYNINSLGLVGNSPLFVDSGPVIINVAGTSAPGGTAINLSGGAVINSGGTPANFQIYYGGSANVTLSGGTASFGVVYAPNAPITITGGADWYGSVIGSTTTDVGGSPVHYDLALANSLLVAGAYYPVSFSWSKF